MNMSRVSALPTPKTVWVRVSARCGHLRQTATSPARALSCAGRSQAGTGGVSNWDELNKTDSEGTGKITSALGIAADVGGVIGVRWRETAVPAGVDLLVFVFASATRRYQTRFRGDVPVNRPERRRTGMRRRWIGNAIQPRPGQRLELLAELTDQRVPFPFVVDVIRHGRDLDVKEKREAPAAMLVSRAEPYGTDQGCGTRRAGFGAGLNSRLTQCRQESMS